MKKMTIAIFHLALYIVFIICTLNAYAQEASFENEVISKPWELVQMIDQVYMYSSDGHLYKLDASGQKTYISGDFPDNLLFLSSGESFLAIQTSTGVVYKFSWVDNSTHFEEFQQLDWSYILENNNPIDKGIVVGNYICLLSQDTESPSFYSVVIYDLLTGAMLPEKILNAMDICCYNAGQLLIYQQFYVGGEIYVYDLSTMQTQKILDVPQGNDINGLAYNKSNGMIAMMGNGAVYTSRDGKPFAESGYLSVKQGNPVRAILADDISYIAIVPDESLYVCNLETGKNLHPLHIAGFDLSEEIITSYRASHPNTPIVFTNYNLSDTDDLALQLVLRTGDVDIYVLRTGMPIYNAMMEKGFALDLSREKTLTQAVQAMYPRMIEQVTLDGKTYGLPVGISYRALGYNCELFQEMDIPIPNSLIELANLIEEFAQRDDALLMHAPLSGAANIILRSFLDTYLYTVADKSHNVSFDPQMLHRLMERWERVAPILDQADTRSVLMDSPALFIENYGRLPGVDDYLYDGYAPLSLAAISGDEEIIPASLYAMIINAGSANQPAAVDFLTFYAQNLSPKDRISMSPDENTPIKNENTEMKISEAEQNIATLSKQLDDCQPEEKKQLTEQLEQAKADLAYWQSSLWLISQADIETYREIGNELTFGREDLSFDTRDKQLHDLIGQFSNRAIDSVRFCNAFSAIYEMSLREE